ncbi:response regulator [Desulfobacca acetoxidans]|uniref:histidine kinase n=1 Tax=Desulfobacca acetoxidans (strain ATCC 700848 / DSM 11109 / ASRB2) TaxID=880072 RepID=F2NCS3_DESAR|nr:response regulator [Desulfobacca acetoxidans]AEB09354.1 multi-sensor signal transduction histidine kinase [Desulfobacca acetoxidans DSM 11109]
MPKSAKILVVDDESAVLEIIRKILVDRGYIVDVASNGLEALKFLEKSRYDLVLSDVKMPEIDGLELLQQIGLLYPDLTTVMLSAFATIRDAVAAIKLGAFDYIAKPVYPEDLLYSIERALKFNELRQATQELEWTLKGAEALGLQVLELAPEADEFQILESIRQEAKQIEDLNQLSEIFLQGAQKITMASRGSIFLFDQEGIHLKCTARSDNQNYDIDLKSIRPGEGVMGYVLQTGRPLLVADVALEPRFYHHQKRKRYATNSFVVAPIIGEKSWGVINLADRCDLKEFSPRELFLVWLLARIFAENLQHREYEAKSRSIDALLKSSRAELIDVRECFDHLSTPVSMGLAVVDQNLKICYLNPTFVRLCDRRKSRVGSEIFSFMKGLSSSDHKRLQQCFERIFQGEKAIDCGRIAMAHAEHGNSICLAQLMRFDSPALGQQIMIVLEDITEISQMQQRLALYEHLAIMGKLSTCVVHELNNPLDGVKRYISLAQLKKDSSEDVARYLSEAQKGLQKMSLAISSILNVANPNRILKTQDTLLSQLREAVKILLLQTKEQRVEIVLSTAPIFEEISFGTDLYTVFVNLIKNAIQAMSEGGKVEIIGQERKDDLEIHFKDNGPGIDPKNLENIFKPFFTTKSEGQGLGLGLAICQKIVARYHGHISLQSVLGQGSDFIVRLPLPDEFHAKAPKDRFARVTH